MMRAIDEVETGERQHDACTKPDNVWSHGRRGSGAPRYGSQGKA